LDKYRKQGGKLKCKQCVQRAEEEERQQAASKRAAAAGHDQSTNNKIEEQRTCAGCHKLLDLDSFNRNQWNKGEGKSKCRPCVEQAVVLDAEQSKASKQAKLEAAREKVLQATGSGNAQAILKAESELSALEAEQVTGLKPVKMGRGGGRGRKGRSTTGRGGGRGRGQ
jgi:hypothetical protein